MENQQNSLSLDQFMDKLLQEKQLPELSPEVMAEMKSDLMSRVEDRINAQLIASMNPDQLAAFTNLLEEDNDQKTQEYLKSNIPDLENVVATALLNFRNTYLGL